MAQEKRSEVHGRRTRDEVAEDVLASLVNDADGELVGKKADASSDTVAELSPRTFRTFRRELSSLEWTISRGRTPGTVFEESSGVGETADDHPDDDHPPPAAAR